MGIEYSASRRISAADLISVLERSGLSKRRPVEEIDRIEGMVEHADLTCTAWDGNTLVGVARSVTDFVYCCYLSDLAVDEAYQGRGIGTALVSLTRSRLSPGASLILLAALGAEEYYPHIGFTMHPSAWTIPGDRKLSGGAGSDTL